MIRICTIRAPPCRHTTAIKTMNNHILYRSYLFLSNWTRTTPWPWELLRFVTTAFALPVLIAIAFFYFCSQCVELNWRCMVVDRLLELANTGHRIQSIWFQHRVIGRKRVLWPPRRSLRLDGSLSVCNGIRVNDDCADHTLSVRPVTLCVRARDAYPALYGCMHAINSITF